MCVHFKGNSRFLRVRPEKTTVTERVFALQTTVTERVFTF